MPNTKSAYRLVEKRTEEDMWDHIEKVNASLGRSMQGLWCHWGLNEGGKVVGHYVPRETEWAVLTAGKKVRGELQTTSLCMDCAKRAFPEALEVKVTEDIPSDVCDTCGKPADSKAERVDAFKCNDCDRLVLCDDVDEVTLRQCSRETCNETFAATDGNNCPQCNSPFTRRLADVACEECLGEQGMEPVKAVACSYCENLVEVPE